MERNIRGAALVVEVAFPCSAAAERDTGCAAPVVEVTGPKTSSVESNARSASLVAEVTVPGGLIEIGCQLSRERRLGHIVFIYLHAIEYVSV